MKKPLIVIAGPTATGKSKLAIQLAKVINGAIISGDSMQIYKYMNIGTAKIMPEEMEGIDHYLVNELYPDETFNVHVFQEMAKEAMRKIYKKGQIPILVGGTGFYIQALVRDIAFDETHVDEGFRMCLEKLARTIGPKGLHERLKEIDPVSYEQIHYNNTKRVIRALEFYHETGKPISEHNATEMVKESPYNLLYYVLHMDRSLNYQRIDQRVDQMFQAGLVEEVKGLKARGYHEKLTSMEGIGYKQIFGALNGNYEMDRAIYLVKRDTRHFAKRQLTWFKRENHAIWLNLDEYAHDYSKILNKVLKDIEVKALL